MQVLPFGICSQESRNHARDGFLMAPMKHNGLIKPIVDPAASFDTSFTSLIPQSAIRIPRFEIGSSRSSC
jgi:hypothetical protein